MDSAPTYDISINVYYYKLTGCYLSQPLYKSMPGDDLCTSKTAFRQLDILFSFLLICIFLKLFLIGGQDYASLTGVVSFSPGASTFSVPIVTSTDSLSEGDEVFEGVLTLAPGSERINLGADVATAVIRNSAPPVPQNVCQIYARTEL